MKKGDYQEVRMDVNNMVAAMAAKTVDAMITVEPYNAIAEADGIASTVMNYWDVDKMPVFMAATPDFVDKSPDTVVAYLKCWQEVARDFKDNPSKVADVIYAFFTSKGYAMSRETFVKALAKVEVDPGFPSDLAPPMLIVLPVSALLVLALMVPELIWTRPAAPVVGPKELATLALMVPPSIVVVAV